MRFRWIAKLSPFTNYDLNVRVEPAQQRLAVRGKITLRNDSAAPQKIAVLQISSSLVWRSITVGGKPLQFVLQAYTSDIDHTGALSEAIVTLPQTVAPQGHIDLEIATKASSRSMRRASPASALRKRGPAARTGTRSLRNSPQCAEWDTWPGIRSRPRTPAYPKARACSRFWRVGRRGKRATTMHLQIAVASSEEDETAPELLVNATAAQRRRKPDMSSSQTAPTDLWVRWCRHS